MKIESFPLGPFETNCYLLKSDTSNHCAIIDAPPGSAEILLPKIQKQKLTLDALLLTHGHWDHTCDADRFAASGATVYAHRDDQICYENPQRFMAWYQAALPFLTENDFRPVKITNWVADGDTFQLFGKTFEVRHVPGHCPGNILFYCAEEKVALVGDAIFQRSVGRSDLPGGNWKTLLTSIRQKIYTLPEEVTLLPGHGGTTTVGDEKRLNPYARPE